MSIRSLADFNGSSWAVRGLADTATVTAQGSRSRPTRRTRGGDFYLATSGDLQLATSEDFFITTDTLSGAHIATQCCAQTGAGADLLDPEVLVLAASVYAYVSMRPGWADGAGAALTAAPVSSESPSWSGRGPSVDSGRAAAR